MGLTLAPALGPDGSWSTLNTSNRRGCTKAWFWGPVGGGAVITHNQFSRLGLVINCAKTFTDYLDDISRNYVDPSLLNTTAYANQSGGVVPESHEVYFGPGEKRGDPNADDNYMTLSLTYSRYILGQNKYYKTVSRWKPKNYNSRTSFKKRKYKRIIRASF